MIAEPVPDEKFAKAIAQKVVGEVPVSVHRFMTGSHHYVFEAAFSNNAPMVVRIAAEHSRAAMIGASILSHSLRPLGVPLPKIIAEDLRAEFAYVVLERLPGRDLRDVIENISNGKLRAIAERIVAAQNIVSRTPSAGRFGYAVAPGDAPRESWSQVLDDSIIRSRERIVSARIFDTEFADRAAASVDEMRRVLDRLPSTPFLHDTTIKNVIVTDDGMFSGIVDVDDLCFGDPRYVVALTLAALRNANASTHYIDEWMGLAGFAEDRIFRLYVTLFILDFMSEVGQKFNDNPSPSSSSNREHLVKLFGECLDGISG